MTRLAEQVGEKDKQITELKEQNEKQAALIAELELQLGMKSTGGPASAHIRHTTKEQKLGAIGAAKDEGSKSGLLSSLMGKSSVNSS